MTPTFADTGASTCDALPPMSTTDAGSGENEGYCERLSLYLGDLELESRRSTSGPQRRLERLSVWDVSTPPAIARLRWARAGVARNR